MANIMDYLKNIQIAVKGKDVRQSIHDAIQQCYYDGKAGAIDLEARQILGTKAGRDEVATERARIDNLAKLKEGSTTGDAELQDIRVGANGTTYENAGAAVRGQVSQLSNDINKNGIPLYYSHTGTQFARWNSPSNLDNTFKKGDMLYFELLSTTFDGGVSIFGMYKDEFSDGYDILLRNAYDINKTFFLPVKNDYHHIMIQVGTSDGENLGENTYTFLLSKLSGVLAYMNTNIDNQTQTVERFLEKGTIIDYADLSFEKKTIVDGKWTGSGIRLSSENLLSPNDFDGYIVKPSDGFKIFIRGFIDEDNISTDYKDWFSDKEYVFRKADFQNSEYFVFMLSHVDDSPISYSDSINIQVFKEKHYTPKVLSRNKNIYELSIDSNKNIKAEKLQKDDLLEDRLLVFEDDFDSPFIDTDKWEALYGFYNADRYYMYKDVSKNAYCENSCLVLKNIKDYPNERCDWSGAFIRTKNKFEFRYGRIEAKIKFPNAPVYHSTFWTLGSNYDRVCDENTQGDETLGVLPSTCGEIDIAEADNLSVATNVHYSNDTENTHVSGGYFKYDVDCTEWHIYSAEWTEDKIEFYVDSVFVGSWNTDEATVGLYNPFKLPHFLMFNSNPGLVEENSTDEEITTYCDWVRVYAPLDVTEHICETGITLNSNNVSLNIGDIHLLTTTFIPDNCTDKTLVWESYNPNVAKCHGGKITAIGTGTTYVRATSKNGCRAMCKVVVN